MVAIPDRELQGLLDRHVAAAKIPAMGAAVVRPWGLECCAVAGVRCLGEPERVTMDDPWHIGSAAKSMTAALYARLVDEGLARWDAAMPDLFPDLADVINPAWEGISIEDLLTHRSGLDDMGVHHLFSSRDDRRPLPVQRSDIAREKLSRPPVKPAGEFAYSNAGYLMIGAAIERILGDSWEHAIHSKIFQPLGMSGAGFGPPRGPVPQGHHTTPFGRLHAVGQGPDADNPPVLGPAGTVHLPLSAWAGFIRIFLDTRQTFLTGGSLARLVTPPDGVAYGMGWIESDDPVSGRILSHAGSNTMWLAQAAVFPEHEVAFLLTANCVSEGAQNALKEATEYLISVLARPQVH